jgi:signal transduction histidine kinase
LEKLSLRIASQVERWNLIQRFHIVGIGIAILGTLMIGWWVGEEIKASIINESAAATALYLDSFITPHLQELSQSASLPPQHAAVLDNLLNKTDLGRQIVALKVWDKNGKILYSNTQVLIGHTFPETDELALAWEGRVIAAISDLSEAENAEERRLYDHLLEIHVPIRLSGTHQVIAIAEFYQRPDTIETEIALAQRQSWLAVASGMGIIYLLLSLFFRWTNGQIQQREVALRNQVAQLRELIAQNDELDLRIRRARANAATLNERLLLRIGAELERQATKKLNASLALLHTFAEKNQRCFLTDPRSQCSENLPIIQSSLKTALDEIVSITSGLGLPHLESMSLKEVFASAVLGHEQRTDSNVKFQAGDLPSHAALQVKITAYRVVQEGLNNAYRHARGLGQEVQVSYEAKWLRIEISDRGPGFDSTLPLHKRERLGLAGMRERVESLGGRFLIETNRGSGTKITAWLPLVPLGEEETAAASPPRRAILSESRATGRA